MWIFLFTSENWRSSCLYVKAMFTRKPTVIWKNSSFFGHTDVFQCGGVFLLQRFAQFVVFREQSAPEQRAFIWGSAFVNIMCTMPNPKEFDREKNPQRAVVSSEGIPFFAEMEECSQGICVSRGSNEDFIYGETKNSETWQRLEPGSTNDVDIQLLTLFSLRWGAFVLL